MTKKLNTDLAICLGIWVMD